MTVKHAGSMAVMVCGLALSTGAGVLLRGILDRPGLSTHTAAATTMRSPAAGTPNRDPLPAVPETREYPDPIGAMDATSSREEAVAPRRDDALLRQLDGLDRDQVYAAVHAVADDPEARSQEREALRALAGDARRDPCVRGIALWGLAQLGETADAADALADPAEPLEVRHSALEMLDRVGGPAALSALETAAGWDPHDSIREAALRALVRLSPATAMPQLVRASRERGSGGLRRASFQLLARLGTPAAIDAVAAAAVEPENGVEALAQAGALFALRAIDRPRVARELRALALAGALPPDARTQIDRLARATEDPEPPAAQTRWTSCVIRSTNLETGGR